MVVPYNCIELFIGVILGSEPVCLRSRDQRRHNSPCARKSASPENKFGEKAQILNEVELEVTSSTFAKLPGDNRAGQVGCHQTDA
jgi:hypothetical protein